MWRSVRFGAGTETSRTGGLGLTHQRVSDIIRRKPYLERHAASVRERTVWTLRVRLRYAVTAFGDVPLRDLERMSGELASWRARLPERSGYGIMSALRQTLEAAVRWGYMASNPAKLAGPNRQPAPRAVRIYTIVEISAIGAELSAMYQPLPAFAAATGLRPEEWQALERRDVDRPARILNVRRTVSGGEIVELAKTSASRRQVPLSRAALAALDELPARLDTPLLPGPARRADEPRQLAPPRVAPRDRGRRGRQAGQDLRHALDVRVPRAGRRCVGVRAGADHGHEPGHD